MEVAARELLWSDVSPLQSAVVSHYGGLEHLTYSDSERVLVSPWIAANVLFPKVTWLKEDLFGKALGPVDLTAICVAI